MKYAVKQDWMQKGARVQLPNNTGTIISTLEVMPGESLGMRTEGPIVLSLFIKPDGVLHAWSFNPNHVGKYTPPPASKRIPFPDHIG